MAISSINQPFSTPRNRFLLPHVGNRGTNAKIDVDGGDIVCTVGDPGSLAEIGAVADHHAGKLDIRIVGLKRSFVAEPGRQIFNGCKCLVGEIRTVDDANRAIVDCRAGNVTVQDQRRVALDTAARRCSIAADGNHARGFVGKHP